MRTQRNIVYITLVVLIISIIIYGRLTITIIPSYIVTNDRYYTLVFCANIINGIIGSAIVTLIISLVTYKIERIKSLEAYKRKFLEAEQHCSKYSRYKTFNEKVDWYQKYKTIIHEMDDIWADIAFLFDPMHHRLYLKDIINFYDDFISLTQNNFRLLGENVNENAKTNIMDRINHIVMKETIYNVGDTTYKYDENRFDESIGIHPNNVHEIYAKPIRTMFKKFNFNSTLVSEDNFILLTGDAETVIKVLCNKIRKSGDASDIEIKTTKDIIDELMKCGYISGFSQLGYDYFKVDCQFITCDYFDLKLHMQRCKGDKI